MRGWPNCCRSTTVAPDLPRSEPGGERRGPRVTVLTLPGCLHCRRARRLLERRGVAYSEVSMAGIPHFRAVLLEQTGGTTVPQIIVGSEPLGGADDLARLDRRGALTARLAGERFPRPVRVRRFSARCLLRWVLTAPSGRGRRPWRYRTELIDGRGHSLGPVVRAPEGGATPSD
ncbi:MAG: hypothetical protein JST08_20050 [Actinobacteria bacterium]|nr:hypothetical protein [Actinomycetota bacterium]